MSSAIAERGRPTAVAAVEAAAGLEDSSHTTITITEVMALLLGCQSTRTGTKTAGPGSSTG